jgi:hypothetical protein
MRKNTPSDFPEDEKMTLKRFNESVPALYNAQAMFIFGCQNLELLHILSPVPPRLLTRPILFSRCVQHFSARSDSHYEMPF